MVPSLVIPHNEFLFAFLYRFLNKTLQCLKIED